MIEPPSGVGKNPRWARAPRCARPGGRGVSTEAHRPGGVRRHQPRRLAGEQGEACDIGVDDYDPLISGQLNVDSQSARGVSGTGTISKCVPATISW
jgi:hypothetical protein